ncbi:DUF916 domain-containing protein [Exiguobacterium sp. SL-9]|uniref:DUF916 domain-containing protein n=1 Tax=Exiguobacterium sp. SL-9 TaxID=2510963 RepID=UPI00104040DC|nr:DUF916 domain-containing protein [Exiguobacterium sp. SL-9]TCI22586.1 DUF916 domain-containing protein [Exiguobacterium sp. SL-9]
MKRWCYVCFVIFVFGWGGLQSPTNAQTGEVDFSVEAVPHEGQIDQSVSYYDLLLSPEEKTTLDFFIHNETNEEMTFDLSVVNASTNGNGVIVYEQSSPSDESIYSVTELIEQPKVVTVEASSSKRVSIQLTAPSDAFSGALLGGIRISRQVDTETSETIGIQNRYVYVLGVKLSMGVKKEAFDPELVGVSLQADTYYPHVAFAVINQTASISHPIQVDMLIESETGKKLRHQLDARFVPHGQAALRFQLGTRLEAGTYEASLQFTDTVTNETWKWEETLMISKDEADEMGERITPTEVTSSGFFGGKVTWLITAVGIVILALFIYIIRLRRQLIQTSEK